MEQKKPQDITWFEEWFNTELYSMLYAQRDQAEARLFVERILAELSPSPKARILDLACGKGRLAIQLADKGYDVIGLDISPHAIEYANRFARANLRFYTHDMLEAFPFRDFDLVFNFFTSFGYFDTESAHVQALRNVSNALIPDGKLVLDFLNTPNVRANLVPTDERIINGVQFLMKRYYDEGFFYKEIEAKLPNGNRHFFHEKVRGFVVQDFERMFQEVGMRIRKIFGDYHLSTYDEATSSRLIMIVEKVQDGSRSHSTFPLSK